MGGNGIARHDVARALPRARVQQLERDGRAPYKKRRALACHNREICQVQLVHQVVRQQIVPQQPAQRAVQKELAVAGEAECG